MATDDWDERVRGKNCSFCEPVEESSEYGVKIIELSVTTLQLNRDQTYRGSSTLIFTARHAAGIEHLTQGEYAAMAKDLRRVSLAMTKALKPDHMNYASLGNSIPHLHWHIIPRYRTDPRWRTNPFWWGPTVAEALETRLSSEEEYQQLAEAIRREL